MSLPYSKFVPISAKVQAPAFVQEKQHALLATTNAMIGTGTPYKEYGGASALTDFANDFGKTSLDYKFASKYFNFKAKNGTAPEKLVVARWFKTAAAPFVKGTSAINTVAELKSVSNGSIKLTFDDTQEEIVVDLSTANSYLDVATILQTAVVAEFTGATVEYNSSLKAFVITGGTAGSTHTTAGVEAGTTGTDLSEALGFATQELSQGADAETFAEFCDRILNANTAGYSITTTETLTDVDINPAVEWLQGSLGDQTINTVVRLVFNITDKATAKALQSTLIALGYTGYVVCYDKYSEQVNALDCAICATIDHQVANGSINFNFQPAVGYTPITTLGTVIDYQAGQTNLSLAKELDDLCISYVYSVGSGSQQAICYGMGLMANDYGTEDVQANEAALEKGLQIAVMNGFIAVNKYKLQGKDAANAISTLIDPVFKGAQLNGAIAYNGTLSDADKIAIYNATANEGAADAVESNGYYFQIQPLTAEDIAARRVRVLVCYLAGGVINVLRISNTIYGA